jgi:hypothetical protein
MYREITELYGSNCKAHEDVNRTQTIVTDGPRDFPQLFMDIIV